VDGFAVGVDVCVGNGIFDDEFDFVGAGCFAKALESVLKQFFRADFLNVEPLFPGFHAGEGEEILGQARHAGGILADDFEKFANVIVGERAVEQGLGVSLDGSKGSAQFVRDVGDEIAARFFHALGFG
jgi:hypothetical protein